MRSSKKKALFAGLLAAGTMLSGLVGMAPTAQAAEQACNNYSSSTSRCVNTQLVIDGTSHSVDWYLPNSTASALMVLNHGFTRGCGNLRGTSKAIAEKGVMVLCVNPSTESRTVLPGHIRRSGAMSPRLDPGPPRQGGPGQGPAYGAGQSAAPPVR